MSYPKREMRCDNCMCWQPTIGNRSETKIGTVVLHGTCHRNAPHAEFGFPVTEPHDWCFEFYPNYESKDYKY